MMEKNINTINSKKLNKFLNKIKNDKIYVKDLKIFLKDTNGTIRTSK